MNYYNEFDPHAAEWLRNLMLAGMIPTGIIDERSIIDVTPGDLTGFTQCHFFAGIGGWSLALRLAGWPNDKPVWTGSCPCQPYSSAGKQLGNADDRNLWPEFYRLIRECRPLRVFGEQVASAIGHGWLDGISTDLEAEGYACGAVVLGAHSVGAPHIRQRLYWMADSVGARLERHAGNGDTLNEQGRDESKPVRSVTEGGGHSWGDNWIQCADGKARRIESSLAPLAHGIPARVVRLRGYGNAIVPQVATEFILSFMECEP